MNDVFDLEDGTPVMVMAMLEGETLGRRLAREGPLSVPDAADVLIQVSSVQEALRGVSRSLLQNHLKHCASTAIRASDAEANEMYDELIDLMYKSNK